MVRPGLVLYGWYPAEELKGLDGPGLEPVMAVKSRVAAVRSLPKGTPVSYGRTAVLERDSRIAVVAHVKNSSTAMEREQGLREGLGSDAEKIADVVFCDSNYDKAYQLMLQILAEHPDVDVVVGLNEYSAVGAARAIVDKGLAGKISFVGFDSSLEEIKMLEGGIFRGMVIQNPFKMGYLGVETAVKALNGEKVPDQIDSGSVLITRENMYLDENQEMLFPFKGE